MFIPNEDVLPEWTSEDAATVRAFVESSAGQKCLSLLSSACPALLDGAHVNKTLVRSGEVAGYTASIAFLLSLRTSRPVEAAGNSESYPSIDNDALWKDSEGTTNEPTN
jgi:hypothetical protein